MRFVFLLSMIVSFTVQAESADTLLQNMMQAMKMNNYQGTLIIRQADQLHAMQLKHLTNDSGMWESLETLNGEARKVVRHNGKVTTIFPQRKLVTVSKDVEASPFPHRIPSDITVLKQLYKINLVGQGRVTGKSAQLLELKPRDAYRYGYKFWLDKETAMLLRCDLNDEQGKVVEQHMFSSLDVLPASAVKMNVPTEDLSQYRTLDLDQGQEYPRVTRWKAKKLPDGFNLIRSNTKPSSHGDGMVHQIVYSDGMSSVSVFIEKHQPNEAGLMGVSRMGAVSAYSFHIDNNHVTVIGEVPVVTVRMIGHSIYEQH